MEYNFLNTRIKRKFLAPIFACMLLFFNCSVTQKKENKNKSVVNYLNTPIQEHSVKSVLWQQTSGEYRALTYQAYRLAKLQIENMLKNRYTNIKPLAIVTDIDETVLDNSPFFAKSIELDEDFNKQRWVDWGKQKNAASIPGALEFFLYASNKNIEVFYISNRYDNQLDETIANLKIKGFPYADKEHVLLKKNISGKEPRRTIVLETHEIVMLLGDNLSDFSNVFESNSIKDRNHFVDSLKVEFGKKFIVLPNPIYGDWENHGIYKGKYNWTPLQKDSIRRSKLISY